MTLYISHLHDLFHLAVLIVHLLLEFKIIRDEQIIVFL